MPVNALVCELCLKTGLRIDDALDLQTKQLGKVIVIYEQKTHKKKVIRLSDDLLSKLKKIAGKYYVFEHRDDPRKHRTRQAVFLDLKRAAKAFRLDINLSPHSLRKVYAVELLKKYGDIEKVKKALNHDNELVTAIYCFSDVLTEQRRKEKNKRKKKH